MTLSFRVPVLSLFAVFFLYLSFGTTPLMAGAGVGVSPSSLNFGSQPMSADTTAPIKVSNTGDSDLIISSVTLTGTNASDFSFSLVPANYRPTRTARGVASSGVVLPLTVSAGSSAAVLVDFKPSAAGSRSATLTITTNVGSPQVIGLSGSAANAGASLSTTSLTFGSQTVGTTSTPQNVTITNNGSANLIVTDITTTGTNGSDFLQSVAVTQQGRRTARGLHLVIPPQGNATVSVAFNPSAAGTRTGTLNIFDNASGSPQTVSLSGTAPTPAGHLSITNLSLGFNSEMLITASVDNAPASTLTLTITSSDANSLLLSSDSNGTTVGTQSITATIAPSTNAVFPGFYAQALASAGTAKITVNAPNYVPGVATVTFGPTGFVLAGPSAGTGFSTSLGATDTPLSVTLTNLDSNLNPVASNPPAKLRAGVTVHVPITSGTTATGTILNSPSTITASNASDSSVVFHPLALGTSLLTLGTPDVAGFSTSATGTQLTATVNPPSINMSPVNVGNNTQVNGTASLSSAAPGGGTQVTITSNNANVKLSTDATGQTVGSSSIILNVPAGQTAIPTFVIQGFASTGTATLTATATGYQTGTASVALTPSGFVIDGGKGVGQPFTATANSPTPTPIVITLMRLDQANNPASAATLRAGFTAPTQIDVYVTGSDDSIGQVFGNGVFNTGGSSDSQNTAFYPFTPGQVTLTIPQQPSGFTPPTSGGTLTATVAAPAISFNTNFPKVGQNLQIFGVGALNTPAASDLTVTFTSNNAGVLLSTDPTTQGSTSINVVVPAGKGVNGIGFPTVYIQALGTASGSATITASTGDGSYASGTASVTVAASSFVLASSNGVGADFATIHSTAGNPTAPSNVSVLSYQVNGGVPENAQPVRGGLTLSIGVGIIVNPSLGTIGNSPVSFSGGVGSGTVTFTPGTTTGVATLKAAQPSGFTAVTASSLKANVN